MLQGQLTPWFLYFKASQEVWDRLLSQIQYLWTAENEKKNCPSTGLIDKITPSNFPIIFRLLKIEKSISELEKGLSFRHQSSICKSTLGCLHSQACPALSHSLPLWSPSVDFSPSLGSTSTVPSTWRLSCFPYLPLGCPKCSFGFSVQYYFSPSLVVWINE